MSHNTGPTEFSHLQIELRLQIWEHAYDNTPPRTIKVIIYHAFDRRAPSVEIQADRLPSLLEVNREARQLLRGRFVNPFSPSLINAVNPAQPRSFANLCIDPSRELEEINYIYAH